MTEARAALETRDLSKTFGGQKALDRVGLRVERGEVHGLLGQNGSGKSTLIKILAGYHAPDPGGRLWVDGVEVTLPLPAGQSRRLGITFVHQHLGLIPALSVTENVMVGRLAASRAVALSWRRLHEETRHALARYELAFDPRTPVARLSAVERALLAVVRAVEDLRAERPAGGILVLDEPTPFLPRRDVERLFALVRQIAADGASVVFVSHDIDEVRDITARATVLRDGGVAGSLDMGAASKDDVIRMILGRHLPPAAGAPPSTWRATLARVSELRGHGVEHLSLEIGAGEIVGLTGLLGSGYESVPYLIYGAVPCTHGALLLDGASTDLTEATPAASIRAGLVLIPGDRAAAGVIGPLPVLDNVTMPLLRGDGRSGLHPWALDRRRMARLATELGRRFEVVPNRPALPVSALSGGNQQKLLLAKWLQTRPRLILLDEPTQGVDVGARLGVHAAIRAAAVDGAGVLCASSDYEQLALLCDRVLVLSRGRIAAELSGTALGKDAIAKACFDSSGSISRDPLH